MAKHSRKVTAESIVLEIDKVLGQSNFYQSRQSGKRFYDARDFSTLLNLYLTQSGETKRQNAYRFGMSTSSLEKILSGGPLSENMLTRVRVALVAEATSNTNKLVFPGDWRDATPAKVSAAISEVSDRLVFLKKVIEQSNSLHSEKSAIDKIQISQLVSLLAATLEALKAPFIDKKQTSGFFRWLAKFAKHAAAKGAEKVVVDAMGDAAHAGTNLLQHLSQHGGSSDIGNILR